MTLWTVALQVSLSMEFSRQEYWSGLPCPPPWHLPDPGIEPRSPTLLVDSLQSEPRSSPSSLVVQQGSACNAGDLGSISGSGKFPGEGNGNSLQYSCQKNPLDTGAWWATVQWVAKEWDMT